MIKETIKIAIVEPSPIIRYGVTAILRRITGLRFIPLELESLDGLQSYLKDQKLDVIIINPSFWGSVDTSKLKAIGGSKRLKMIALVTSAVDVSMIKKYDATIGMYESSEEIGIKIEKLFAPALEEENPHTLSVREKEIIVGVVKGLTNKEIAESLFISTHTVLTHRKNIARKLEIHSPAGLTIYAIVNKLVDIQDLNLKL
jgi:DNA-binding NarL/FixJ family response regulator